MPDAASSPRTDIDPNTAASLLVAAAREELLPRFRRVDRAYKTDGSVVTEADGAVQARLERELTRLYPHIPLLGEEMDADRQRQVMTRAQGAYWCLDPLDGTSNFASGVPFYAISLALVDARGPILGMVYDPERDELFAAGQNATATLNGRPLEPAEGRAVTIRRSIAAVDFKRLDADLAHRLATRPPYASQRNFGACALEWCWLAAGRFQLYLHGGQKFWDYAAGTTILAQAGGAARTLEGEPLFDATLAPRSAVATREASLLPEWRAVLAA